MYGLQTYILTDSRISRQSARAFIVVAVRRPHRLGHYSCPSQYDVHYKTWANVQCVSWFLKPTCLCDPFWLHLTTKHTHLSLWPPIASTHNITGILVSLLLNH